MPIYEYLCRKCNTIFQFFIRSPGLEAPPACPRCGGSDMERVMSSFSTARKPDAGSSGAGDMPDFQGLDESDPRSMARAIRRTKEMFISPILMVKLA
jgi:putative FmdB family regulatory protein